MREFLTEKINEKLITCIISNVRQRSGDIQKYKIRPILKGDHLLLQVEEFKGNQVFHRNLATSECIDFILRVIEENSFRQMDLYTADQDYHVLFNKKNEYHIQEKKATMELPKSLSHNRQKEYLLPENTPIPFLVHLGVMTSEGKVVAKKYDKFRQINRFLEMVEDVLPALNVSETLRVIDFGCGKSYLTFALYYYLTEIKKYSVLIHGLDLKKDVIEHCNALAKELDYKCLSFSLGNIDHFETKDPVHMVISLHACDTATDFALQKAVSWGSKVILSVPCCQHELNEQIKCLPLSGILQYGLIKERIAALMTDAIRANWLELKGYTPQILEFIDMEHTPKNILIRAVRTSEPLPKSSAKYTEFKELQQYLNANLTLQVE